MNLLDKVFVDTSFFIALLNSNDRDHPRAVALQVRLAAEQIRKVTSELTTALTADHHFQQASYRALLLEPLDI